jgi:hypothetical protein
MVDHNAKHQQAVQNMANQIRVAFFLSLLTNLYDMYHFINASGEFRQGMSITLGALGTGLIWLIGKELRAGKKLALYYWIGLLLVGTSRWIFLDAAFEWNILSIVILAFVIGMTLKMVSWARSRVLA